MKTTKLLFVLLLLPAMLFAQIGERIIFPSPQAAQMGKFGGYNVNHSSGTANVGIPIYAASEGGINIPLSLAYNYRGFRPSDEPGFCGLGWSLIAAGSISRVMKSTADEIVAGQPTKIKTFVEQMPPSQTNYEALALTSTGNNYPESEPDIFSFQFDGFSGKFVLDENGAAKVISNQIMNISFQKSAYGPENKQVITKWTVTAENGSLYTFDAFEVSFQDENALYIFPTSWYLTEIINIRGDRVSFEYSTKDNNKRRVQAGITDQSTNASYTSSITKNYSLEIYLQKIKGSTWEVLLNSSEFSAGFVETAASTARKLDNIQVKNTITNTVTRQFNFSYLDVATTKLTLQSMGEPGLPPYTFQYFNTIPRELHGNTRQVDAWGYYNGWENPSLLPTGMAGVDLNPRLNLTKNGVLTSISYPTGGSTSFEYQQNEYSYVRTMLTTKSKKLIEDHDFYFRNMVGAPVTGNPIPTITLNATTRVDIRFSAGATSPTNCTNMNGSGFQTFQLPAGSYSGNDLLKMSAFTPCNQIFGNCADPGDPCGYFPPDGYDVNLSVKVFKESDIGRPYYGGIRVSKMTDTPVIPGGPAMVTNYSYSDEDTPSLASGVIIQEPVYDITVSPFGVTNRRVIRSNPFNPMAMNSLYYQFVKETNGLTETSHSFTSHVDKDDILGKFAFTYQTNDYEPGVGIFLDNSYLEFGDFQFYDFMRGLPKKVVVKDLLGNLKLEKTTTYAPATTDNFKVPSVYHDLLASFQDYAVAVGSILTTYRIYYGKGYYVVGGWPRKIAETTTNYGSEGASPVSTTENFEYGNINHRQLTKQRSSRSDGSIRETNYKYPLDYSPTGNGAIQSMITSNMVTYPLEQVTWIEKSPSDRKVIDASVTTYKSFTGNANKANLILPYKKFRFKGLNGSIASFTPYDGSTDETASPSYNEMLKFASYDNQGNPLTLLTDGRDNLSYLWAYKGQHPVAEILNADNAAVAGALGVTSFSQMADKTVSADIKAKLDAVRSALPDALQTSYQYLPTVGVSAVADPAGKNLGYDYDAYGRLTSISNNAGPLRASYCYNYAGQAISCISISASGTVNPAQLFLITTGAPPLPVTLVEFKAEKKEKAALLTWNTTEEINSKSFEIQRSLDGKKWVQIGSVDAKGGPVSGVNAVAMQYYSFVDGSPAHGENLYRLKMIDRTADGRDDTFAYSRIQSLSFDSKTAVYPNPVVVGQKLNLDTPGAVTQVQIYDVRGNVVYTQDRPASEIDVSSLQSGSYIVQITGTDGLVSTHRIVKQ